MRPLFAFLILYARLGRDHALKQLDAASYAHPTYPYELAYFRKRRHRNLDRGYRENDVGP